MRIEKYHAEDMKEAFRLIKADLGPDAVVIQTRKVRIGGVLGAFRRPVYEVLAAVDEDPRPASGAAASGGKFVPGLPGISSSVARPAQPPSSARKDPAAARATTLPAANGNLRPADEGSREGDKPNGEGVRLASSDVALLREMKSNMVDLKTAMGRLSKQAQFGNIANFAPNLVKLYQRLVDQELAEDLAQDIVLRVNSELGANGVNNYELVREYVRKHIQELIAVTGPPKLVSGTSKAIFLIGPTGVGKTTTLAKLAANYCLIEHKKVALVTVDTFRIAAIPQLRTYAEIIGVPLEVVYTASELGETLNRFKDKDLVLIDTPGGSPRNSKQLQMLKEYLDAVQSKELFLAVASPTKYRDMLDVFKRFSISRIDGLLFTKIDETDRYGPLINLLSETKTRLTYLTTGQNVPNDIELADSVKMAELLLTDRVES